MILSISIFFFLVGEYNNNLEIDLKLFLFMNIVTFFFLYR